MPIAYIPGAGGPVPPAVSDTLQVIHPTAVLDPAPPVPLQVGHTVYIADDAGTPTYKLCGALTVDRPDLLMGFIASGGVGPGTTLITTGRGSRVVPVVEGGAPLVPEQEVWLSATPGEVTQTPPYQSGTSIVRVGVATSTTEIILNSDFRQVIP